MPAEPGAVDPGCGEVAGEGVAGGVAADGGDQADRAAGRGQRAGDVAGHPARLARDPARHVGAGRQRRGGPADDVPVRGADAEELRAGGVQAGQNSSLM